MAFKFDPNELKKSADTLKQQAERKGSFKSFQFKEKESYLLILQKDNQFIFDVALHEVWKNKKPIFRVGSPTVNQEEDPIMKRGWEIREKFLDCGNEKLEGLFRKYMPRNQSFCRVIDLKNISEGVQIAALPKLVKDAIIDQVSEIETEEQAKAVFDLDLGRILKVTHNGGQGINKKYEVAKFLDKRAGLVKSGKVDPEEIEKQMFDLKKLQPSWDDAKLQKCLALIEEEVKYIIEQEGGDSVGDFEITSDDFDTNDSLSIDSGDDFDLD